MPEEGGRHMSTFFAQKSSSSERWSRVRGVMPLAWKDACRAVVRVSAMTAVGAKVLLLLLLLLLLLACCCCVCVFCLSTHCCAANSPKVPAPTTHKSHVIRVGVGSGKLIFEETDGRRKALPNSSKVPSSDMSSPPMLLPLFPPMPTNPPP